MTKRKTSRRVWIISVAAPDEKATEMLEWMSAGCGSTEYLFRGTPREKARLVAKLRAQAVRAFPGRLTLSGAWRGHF